MAMPIDSRSSRLLLLFLSLLLMACSSTSSSPSQPHSSPLLGPYVNTPPAAQGQHGSLVFSDRQFPDSVNPLFAGSSVDLEVDAALWGAPVVFDDHFRVQ